MNLSLPTSESVSAISMQKDRLNRDDGAQKSDIERYKKIYDSLTAVSGKNRQAMELIAYAEAIREWLAETYKEKELTIREDLKRRSTNLRADITGIAASPSMQSIM
ncbi:MAG: hypothetical protein ACLR8L_06900 [Oscillospiraceae bacterium]